jgi:hypothetical protein
LDEVVQLVRVAAGMGESSDRAGVDAAVAACRRLRSWCDGVEVRAARQLQAMGTFPEAALAEAAQVSMFEAARVVDRAAATEAMPVFDQRLRDGRVTGAQVDALGRALRRLGDAGDELAGRAGFLAAVAERSTAAEFERTVRQEVQRIERRQGDDGSDRLERQRRAARLRTWTDAGSGMWCVRGEFDPATGSKLAARLQKVTDALFAERAPSTAPADPRERQDHLRALAFAELAEHGPAAGAGSGSGVRTRWRSDVLHVVHSRCQCRPDRAGVAAGVRGGSVVSDAELPTVALADLIDDPTTRLWTAHVDGTEVLSGPAPWGLGRSQRTASLIQRAILRGWYRGCAIPGCTVAFEHCTIHHVRWWRHFGLTDLDNLLPVCELHHHRVHDGGWLLKLTPGRDLTVTLPNGRPMHGGVDPPPW